MFGSARAKMTQTLLGFQSHAKTSFLPTRAIILSQVANPLEAVAPAGLCHPRFDPFGHDHEFYTEVPLDQHLHGSSRAKNKPWA